MRTTDCVPGSSGIPSRKLRRWVTAEMREGFEELLGGRLRACVGGAYFEVLLHEGCGGGRPGASLGISQSAEAKDVEDDDDNSGKGERRASEAAFAHADAHQPESIDRCDDEGEAVGSGDGREADQQGIIDLGDTEQIPRKTGDAGAGEFYRNPGEGDQQQRSLASEAVARRRR